MKDHMISRFLSAANVSRRGFTLTEFSIVMVISGLLLAMALQIYSIYIVDKRQKTIYDRIDNISASYSMYFSVRGRYPCPSDPSLPFNDPMAGIEQCAAADVLAVGECTGAGNTGICRVPGARDISTLAGAETVLTGGIPYRSLKTGMENTGVCFSLTTGETTNCFLPDGITPNPDAYNPTEATMQTVNLQETLDPWDYQFTYVVSDPLTRQATFDPSYGVIGLRTETGISLVRPENSAHFVIISHGENHKGAYNVDGIRDVPCTAGTRDSQNCDLSGSTVDRALFVSSLRNMNEGAAYFDDVVVQRSYTISELWKFSGSENQYIHNANPGYVGIGTPNPTQKLDVAGNVRALATKSEKICDINGNNCWEPAKLGGSGMSCPAPAAGHFYAMTGIRFGQAVCVEVPLPTTFAGQSCSDPDQYMVGFKSNGEILCEDPGG